MWTCPNCKLTFDLKVNSPVLCDCGTMSYDGIILKSAVLGVGSRIAKYLNWIFIYEKEGCRCKTIKKILDNYGPAKCRVKYNKIVNLLHKQANKRKIIHTKKTIKIFLTTAIRRTEIELERANNNK